MKRGYIIIFLFFYVLASAWRNEIFFIVNAKSTDDVQKEEKRIIDQAIVIADGEEKKAKADKDIQDASRNFYSGKLSNKDQQALFSKEGITKTLLPRLATWITGFLAAISVLFLMYAGYEYMTAGGEEEKLTHARNTALYTILGVVLMMFAYALVYLFLTLFTP